ncbi:MAG TPA: DNA-directed RNA polymerase subunit omega [Pyrinomonadaceae bacterium]|nr:DNA-directed RNA polymerase subunit omega [Pyrinomonadaceae bacterium]
MSEMYNSTGHDAVNSKNEERWPGVDSRFRLVMVAAQRSKQLQRGARPRIGADPGRRRSTTIALEEVKLGLVPFVNNTKEDPAINNESLTGRPATGDAD